MTVKDKKGLDPVHMHGGVCMPSDNIKSVQTAAAAAAAYHQPW
jgi:hypothetical protein